MPLKTFVELLRHFEEKHESWIFKILKKIWDFSLVNYFYKTKYFRIEIFITFDFLEILEDLNDFWEFYLEHKKLLWD